MKKETTTPTATELKAQAYDLLVKIETHQLAIQELQQQLAQVNEQVRAAESTA